MKRLFFSIFLALTFAFLLAPIVTVVITSFSAGGVLSFPPRSLTTYWYTQIDPGYYHALYVSMIVASVATAVAVLVGVPGALALARGHFPGRDALNAIALSPLMIPGLVIGVALFLFALHFWDTFRITLGGTYAGLVIGHLTFAIPFVVRAVLASHTGFDLAIEEAAQNLGATPLQTMFSVTLPVLRPGIISGAIFAFLMSIDEVPISLFLGGANRTTLPVKIFSAIEVAFDGSILAVSSLLVGASIILMFILDRMVGLERLFATRH